MNVTAPSRAKEFFERIVRASDPPDLLRSLIGGDASGCEMEYREYKGAKRLHKDDLANDWSRYLSCFANSDGGVLIWGIDAPKDNKPRQPSLVQDLNAFTAKLHELLRDATEPPVQNVDIRPYPEAPGSKTGFIVCYIPASPWRPHEARVSAVRGFYTRAGDNCQRLCHSQLRALFAPQNVSVLTVHYSVSNSILKSWLINAGPSSASDVVLICDTPKGRMNPSIYQNMWRESSSGTAGIALLATRPIHPKEVVPIFDYQWAGAECFRFQVSARDQLPLKYSITLKSKGEQGDGTFDAQQFS